MPRKAGKNDARLNFRLRSELKRTIEQAAAERGQSVSDFAVSVLVRSARETIQQYRETRLSDRDREIFTTMLDRAESQPNSTLAKASEKYPRPS